MVNCFLILQVINTNESDENYFFLAQIRVFDSRGKECITSWQPSSREILGIQLSNDENSIFVLDREGKISSWSLYQVIHN